MNDARELVVLSWVQKHPVWFPGNRKQERRIHPRLIRWSGVVLCARDRILQPYRLALFKNRCFPLFLFISSFKHISSVTLKAFRKGENMSANVVIIHGYGLHFLENAVGIIPSKLNSFLSKHLRIRKKIADKAPAFYKVIRENKESAEIIPYGDCEIKYDLGEYQWDDTSCCGMAALFVDTVNELKEIGLEVQWDDENGNVVMLQAAAPWEYSEKQKEITSSEHLSNILAECSMESGIVVNTDVDFVTAECWG